MVDHRYNTRFKSRGPKKRRKKSPQPPKPQKQLTLRQCPKVVVLRTSKGCFTAEDLSGEKSVLEAADSQPHQLIASLLKLASLDITDAHLEGSGVAESVQAIITHEDWEVARTAQGLHLKFQRLISGKEEIGDTDATLNESLPVEMDTSL